MSTPLIVDDLNDIVQSLTSFQTRKQDLVVPVDSMLFHSDGTMRLKNVAPVIDETGVTTADGKYKLSKQFVSTAATKLKVPASWLSDMYVSRPDVFAAVMNKLLHGNEDYGKYPSNPLIRTYTPPEDSEFGWARCFMSDKYLCIDHLDVLNNVMGGIESAGLANEARVTSSRLSESRMMVNITVPSITVEAENLLEGYRSPLPKDHGKHFFPDKDDRPLVAAGLCVTNSETGGSAASIVPYITVIQCLNGLKLTQYKEARRIHVGSKLDTGEVKWNEDTLAATNQSIKLQTRDAIKQWLTPEFLASQVRELEDKAAKPVEDVTKAIENVTKKLSLTQSEASGIMSHFIQGGQVTAGGVMQAMTSFVQNDDLNADRAMHITDNAVKAMELV